jgi:hypothetical protein
MILSLGLLPLIALIIKMVHRCSHQYHWIDGNEDKSEQIRNLWAWDGMRDHSRESLAGATGLLRTERELTIRIQQKIQRGENPADERIALWANSRQLASINQLPLADILAHYGAAAQLPTEDKVALVRRLEELNTQQREAV